jgi:hypothetical protein
LRQLQDVEDALFEILLERNLDDAVGVQLETIADIVGQPRTTSDDARFRTSIRARIAINLSDGVGEDLIKVLRLLLVDGETFEIREEPRAQVRATVLDPLTSGAADLIALLLRSTKAGGVRLVFQWNKTLALATDKLLLDSTVGASTAGGGLGSTTAGGGTGKLDSAIGP